MPRTLNEEVDIQNSLASNCGHTPLTPKQILHPLLSKKAKIILLERFNGLRLYRRLFIVVHTPRIHLSTFRGAGRTFQWSLKSYLGHFHSYTFESEFTNINTISIFISKEVQIQSPNQVYSICV